MIWVNCGYCQRGFVEYKCNNRKYCCRKCYDEGRKRDTLKRNRFICPICGVVFTDIRKKRRLYCSNRCKADSFKGKPIGRDVIEKAFKTRVKNNNACGTSTYVDNRGFVVIARTSKHLHTAIAETCVGEKFAPKRGCPPCRPRQTKQQ